MDNVDWIRRCPRLVELNWNLIRRRSPVRSLIVELKRSTWPSLSCLRLEYSIHTDNEFSDLITALPRLESLVILRSTFGPLSLASLKAHPEFQELRTFSVVDCDGFTGAMAQAVLEQCPSLELFAVPFITALDIAREDSRSWACSETLRSLSIFIHCGPHDIVESRQKVFDQLNRLSRLQSLDLGEGPVFRLPNQIRDASYRANTLSLSLASVDGGLANLAGLTWLRYFRFQHTSQLPLGKNEVYWILDHWKNLDEVDGQFTNTGILQSSLRDIFHQHGIVFRG